MLYRVLSGDVCHWVQKGKKLLIIQKDATKHFLHEHTHPSLVQPARPSHGSLNNQRQLWPLSRGACSTGSSGPATATVSSPVQLFMVIPVLMNIQTTAGVWLGLYVHWGKGCIVGTGGDVLPLAKGGSLAKCMKKRRIFNTSTCKWEINPLTS